MIKVTLGSKQKLIDPAHPAIAALACLTPDEIVSMAMLENEKITSSPRIATQLAWSLGSIGKTTRPQALQFPVTSHRQQIRRRIPRMGEEERWLPVVEPGFEDLYEVSDRGRVRSIPRQTVRGMMGGRVLKPGIHRKGYHFMVLSGHGRRKPVTVHKLELCAFDRWPEPGEECRHGNGDPTDNHWPENISWGTPDENQQDRIRHGTSGKGEQNAMAKLTIDQIREIRRRGAVENQTALAREFGIRQSQVSRIVTRQRWGHIPDE
jgi:hypothetical protein